MPIREMPPPSTVRSSMQGGLLIAVPRLADPNFHRMVVLMINHDEQGAFGVVLGPRSQVPISELCSSLEIDWSRPDTPFLRYGGPCEPNRIWLLIGGEEPLPGTLSIAPGVHLGSTTSVLKDVGDRADLPLVVLAGYAGWGPGQLENEIQENSWLPGDVTAEIVFDTGPDDVWEAALRQMDLTPSMIAPGRASA